MNPKQNILTLLALTAMFSCRIFDEGKNELIKEYYNPQQSMKVIVFKKPGNATVSNSIQASIEGYDYELTNKDVGNVFVADQLEGMNLPKDSLLIVKWIDNNTVEFTYHAKIRTFKTEKGFENNVGKVNIKYRTTVE